MKAFVGISVVGLLLLCSGCLCRTPQSIPCRESRTTYAAEVLAPYVKSGELPGVISVFYDKGVQETLCLGYADTAKKIPITMDKMFMQCSQTKAFCGVTMAILLEEGKISLDDPVSKYLKEFKDLKVALRDKKGKIMRDKKRNVLTRPAKNVLTVRMVMNHTGGFLFEIPTKSRKGWTRLSLRDTAREAAGRFLLFEPGTKASYSNTGIDIGAAVIEVVTGKKWEDFLKERLLDPLGMKDTTFRPTGEQLRRALTLYGIRKGQKKPFYKHFSKYMPRPYNGPQVHPSAGGGLWTTATDQLKFYKMLMNLGTGENGVRILKPQTVKKYLVSSTRPAGFEKYSLGLHILADNWFGHGGLFGTYCSVNWKNKQLRLRVLHLDGPLPAWWSKWHEASNKFFKSKSHSPIDAEAYTNRSK